MKKSPEWIRTYLVVVGMACGYSIGKWDGGIGWAMLIALIGLFGTLLFEDQKLEPKKIEAGFFNPEAHDIERESQKLVALIETIGKDRLFEARKSARANLARTEVSAEGLLLGGRATIKVVFDERRPA